MLSLQIFCSIVLSKRRHRICTAYARTACRASLCCYDARANADVSAALLLRREDFHAVMTPSYSWTTDGLYRLPARWQRIRSNVEQADATCYGICLPLTACLPAPIPPAHSRSSRLLHICPISTTSHWRSRLHRTGCYTTTPAVAHVRLQRISPDVSVCGVRLYRLCSGRRQQCDGRERRTLYAALTAIPNCYPRRHCDSCKRQALFVRVPPP